MKPLRAHEPKPKAPPLKIALLFVGEAHQVFHALPLAAEIQNIAPDIEIELLFTDKLQMRMAERVYYAYPNLTALRHILLDFPLLNILQKMGIVRKRPRIAMLFSLLNRLRRADAIIVPERTTTAIRHLLPRKSKLIFTPHGAGDRAITFDVRDRHFDFALVAGPKSEERMLAQKTIRSGHYAVNGYIKADLMQKLRGVQQEKQRFFDNQRPTILYAPHFRRSLSSWDKFGLPLINAFAEQDRFNLIVAPHFRLFSDASPAERETIENLSIPGKIIIDLHSDRLFDMSYALGADIYLGDVSSQVYEFLIISRPCVFLDAHNTQWQNDPDYLFWTLGDVAKNVGEAMAALEVANTHHGIYRERQIRTLADSIGGDPIGAARRGAEAILAFMGDSK